MHKAASVCLGVWRTELGRQAGLACAAALLYQSILDATSSLFLFCSKVCKDSQCFSFFVPRWQVSLTKHRVWTWLQTLGVLPGICLYLTPRIPSARIFSKARRTCGFGGLAQKRGVERAFFAERSALRCWSGFFPTHASWPQEQEGKKDKRQKKRKKAQTNR